MIAGVFNNSKQSQRHSAVNNQSVKAVVEQLCADSFAPLAAIPHHCRQVFQDNQVGLLQQSINRAQCLSKCETTGQICVSWSELDNAYELQTTLSVSQTTKNNNASLILAAYQHWQEACTEHIKGDFVFAIYDPKRSLLLVARDRMGARPLYYSDDDGRFLFSSNLAAIAKLDGVNNKPSSRWIVEYLFKHNTDNSQTGFSNIKKLPAGHMLRVDLDNGKVDVEQYWQLEDLLTKSYCKDHLEAYRNAFDHAVLKRLKQTQTLGIELSGGLDSSSIMASLMMQKPNTNVHCFSRAYFALEKQLIQSISDHYPSKNNYLWDDPNTSHHGFQKSLNDYIQLFGLPDEHSLAIDTHTFLETAREQNITTLLSGFGGDEFSSSLARDVILQLVDERRFFSAYARLSGNPIKRIFEVVRLSLKKPRRPDYLPAMLCLDNEDVINVKTQQYDFCLLYTSPSPRDQRGSRMPSSA